MSWEIAPGILYLTRADWNADESLPRLGEPLVPRTLRTHAIMHHTVIIDPSDRTPNVWEDVEWIKIKMWRLQTIRPDLGMDVPYNWVAFLRPAGALAICEGRGYDHWGAHTAGGFDVTGRHTDDRAKLTGSYRWHNGSGVALAIQGNLEDYTIDLSPWLPKLSVWWGHVKTLLPYLGTVRPAQGAVFGHQHFAQTACPGWYLFRRISEISFSPIASGPEEDAVKLISTTYKDTYWAFVTDGIHRWWVPGPAIMAELQAKGVAPMGPTQHLSEAACRAIPSLGFDPLV